MFHNLISLYIYSLLFKNELAKWATKGEFLVAKVLVALAIVLVAVSGPDLFEGIRQFNSTVD